MARRRKDERLRVLSLLGKPANAGEQAATAGRPKVQRLAEVTTGELTQKIADAKQRLQRLREEFPGIWNLRGLGDSPVEQQMLRLEQFINECSAELTGRKESTKPEPTIPDALKGSPDIVKRSAIIAQNPQMNAAQLCKQFDLQELPLVGSWRQRFSIEDWRSAYKNQKCRGLVDKLISKARSQLR